MTRNAAPAITNYTLSKDAKPQLSAPIGSALKRLLPLLANDKRLVALAFIAMLVTSVCSLLGPAVISRTVDTYIQNKNFRGVLTFSAILLGIYLCGVLANYYQTLAMGTVGRTVLFKLRNTLFTKLQQLPLAFFNQNKAGDLISRINNDTDKLNQFFSQFLVQLFGNLFMMTGAAVFILVLDYRLGLATLLPGASVLVVTQLISKWVKAKSLASLQSLGGLSAEIQESLSNFKVIVAFNRVDYFRQKFNEANQENYEKSVAASLAGGVVTPLYALALNLAQLIVLGYGIYLIGGGTLTVGLLIGFLLYVNSFYMPLQQIAVLWGQLQLTLAAVDRISEVLALETNMQVISDAGAKGTVPSAPNGVLEFENVH